MLINYFSIFSTQVIILNGHGCHCAMDVAMHYIGGKWKTVVLLSSCLC